MMNGCLKQPNDLPTDNSLNLSQRSSVITRSDFSSSTESLLTLLSVSIQNQQFNLTKHQEVENRSSIQNCMKQSTPENHMNNSSINFITETRNSFQNLNHSTGYELSSNMDEVIKQEVLSPKKSRKRNQEVVEDIYYKGTESSDCSTNSKNKKKKRKYSSSLEADEDIHLNVAKDLSMENKSKRKKHKEPKDDHAKNKTTSELKSTNKLNISNSAPSDSESTANEKIKRKKGKHLNLAEADREHNKIRENNKHSHLQLDEDASVSESASHKKSKKKKHKKTTEENQEIDLESIHISGSENITTDNESVVSKKRKKKKHKLSTLEADHEYKEGVSSDVAEDLSINKNETNKKIKRKKHEAMQDEGLISTNETLTTDKNSAMDKKAKKKKHHQNEHLGVTKKKHEELELITSTRISENIITDNDNSVDKKIKKKKKKHTQLPELDPENEQDQIVPHKQFQVTKSLVAEDLSISKDVTPKKNKNKQHKERMEETSNNEPPKSTNNLSATENLNMLIQRIKNKKYEEKQIGNVRQEPLSDSNSNLATDLSCKRSTFPTKIKLEKHKKITDRKNNEVVDYVNEVLDEKSEMDTTLLKNMAIVVPWAVPVSHAIETRISAPPTKEQQEAFSNLGIKMKTGPYSQKEDQQIRGNWAQFCYEHDVDPNNPSLFMVAECKHRNMLSTEERVNFARYLGRGLENRTLYRIYQRFQLLFSTHKKGKFSPEEDNMILEYVKHADKSRYSIIASALNRHKDSVRKRYDYLQSISITSSKDDKFRWTTELMEDLVKNLLEVTNTGDVNDLKEFPISTAHWKKIRDKMGTPSSLLKRKWNSCIYPQLFTNPEQVTLREVQEQLINLLGELNEPDRRNINWNDLALNFDGLTGTRLNKIFVDLLKSYVPNRDSFSFSDSIIYLHTVIPSLRLNNRKLKRLQYVNGKLVDY